jgi:hypothetical protein
MKYQNEFTGVALALQSAGFKKISSAGEIFLFFHSRTAL